MLSVKKYPESYIVACQIKIEKTIAAFDSLPATTTAFENLFFNNSVLLLEQMFVHRMRGQEGKDGNAINEVRLLAASLLTTEEQLLADSSIKYNPATVILGLPIGERIALTKGSFKQLADAFFSAIKIKFS